MASTNRRTIREQFTALAKAAIEGNEAALVLDYVPAQLTGRTLLCFTSGPTMREPGGLGPCWANRFRLYAWLYVRYPRESDAFTDQDALDQADDLEAALADVVRDNRSTAYWNHAEYGEPTLPDQLMISGLEWRQEVAYLDFVIKDAN